MGVAATLVAAGIRFLAAPLVGENGQFLLFVLAVVFASESAGLAAGLLSTALSTLALLLAFPDIDKQAGSIVLFALAAVGLCLEGERRRRIRHELRRVHHNLEAAQQIANIGSWESDLEERLWWSPETYRILGVAEGTPVSRNDFFELIHPEDVETVREAVGRASSSRGEYDIEHRIMRKSDGAVRHVHQRGRIVIDTTISLIGSVQDVTEARAQQRALERARERLALQHEVGRLGTYEWFVEENRVVWSPEMERLYGISSGTHEHTFEEWKALLHPDDLLAAVGAVTDAMENRRATLDSSYRVIRPDGEVVWIHSRGRYDYDAAGKPTRMIGVNMDITEMKRAAVEIERANHIMDLAFEAGRSGASAWDLETNEQTWTASYRRLLGIDAEVLATPDLFFSRIHPDDLARVKADLGEALAGRKDDFLLEFRLLHPDGIRWIERRGRVFHNAAGKAVHLVSIDTDITERRVLRGLLPTCAQCKKIRDEHDRWEPFEVYLSHHSEVRFSHGMCPECLDDWSRAEGL